MTTNEIMRVFDITIHAVIFIGIIWRMIEFPNNVLPYKIAKAAMAFSSLFLALTCWHYGRSQTFLALHNFWQLTLVVLIFYYPKRTI